MKTPTQSFESWIAELRTLYATVHGVTVYDFSRKCWGGQYYDRGMTPQEAMEEDTAEWSA